MYQQTDTLILLFTMQALLQNSNAQITPEAFCNSCISVCKESWRTSNRMNICEPCLLSFCANNSAIIANFFRSHSCTSVDVLNMRDPLETPFNGERSSSRSPATTNRGLTNAFHDTVITSLNTRITMCKASERAKTSELNQCRLDLQEAREVNELELDLSRFVDKSYTFRSYSSIRSAAGSIQGDPICSSYSRIYSPMEVEHRTGLTVKLLRTRNLKQVFHVRSCHMSTPLIRLPFTASCQTVKNLHKAYIVVPSRTYDLRSGDFQNCAMRGSSYFCDDWVKLPAFCAVHRTTPTG